VAPCWHSKVGGPVLGGWPRVEWVAPWKVGGTVEGGWHRGGGWHREGMTGGWHRRAPRLHTGMRPACTQCREIRPTPRNRTIGSLAELGARHHVGIPRRWLLGPPHRHSRAAHIILTRAGIQWGRWRAFSGGVWILAREDDGRRGG
jgi:hypothetical protein